MAQNGSLSSALPDTSVTVPTNSSASQFTIKFFHGTGLTSGSGWLSNFRLYSNVVTDMELQNLSFRKHQDSNSLAINAVQVIDGSITNLKLSDEQLVAAFQYANALIFPSVSEGKLSSPEDTCPRAPKK